MMKGFLRAVKHLKNGGSLKYLAAGEPYCPFGEDFGLAIVPDYLQDDDVNTLRFGYADVYTRRSASIKLTDGRFQLPPIPLKSYMPVVKRMEQDGLLPPDWLNCHSVNMFEEGDFIRAHVDNMFIYDDIVAVVSIGSNALLRFVHAQSGEELDVVIPERSLYVMSGPARYVYFHMVLPVETQRVSVVFRRSIARSSDSFRGVSTPLGELMPYRATELLHALQSKQVGSVRMTVADAFLENEEIGAFDTSAWVKRLHPLRDWSLLRQLSEDEARIAELTEKGEISVDLSWRVKELRRYYEELERNLVAPEPTT